MATMQDVARLANVSLSTVSYALSGSRPVSAATKARVEVAMAELGFTLNALARGLASRRSRTLALIFPAMENGIGGTVAEFVSSAAATARSTGTTRCSGHLRRTMPTRSVTWSTRAWPTAPC